MHTYKIYSISLTEENHPWSFPRRPNCQEMQNLYDVAVQIVDFCLKWKFYSQGAQLYEEVCENI
jgi:hypothetical protein